MLERSVQSRPAIRRHVRRHMPLLSRERTNRRGPHTRRGRLARRRVLCHVVGEVPPRRGDGTSDRVEARARYAPRRLERHEGQTYTKSDSMSRRGQRDLARDRQEANRRAHRRGSGCHVQARAQAQDHHRVRRVVDLPRPDSRSSKNKFSLLLLFFRNCHHIYVFSS